MVQSLDTAHSLFVFSIYAGTDRHLLFLSVAAGAYKRKLDQFSHCSCFPAFPLSRKAVSGCCDDRNRQRMDFLSLFSLWKTLRSARPASLRHYIVVWIRYFGRFRRMLCTTLPVHGYPFFCHSDRHWAGGRHRRPALHQQRFRAVLSLFALLHGYACKQSTNGTGYRHFPDRLYCIYYSVFCHICTWIKTKGMLKI